MQYASLAYLLIIAIVMWLVLRIKAHERAPNLSRADNVAVEPGIAPSNSPWTKRLDINGAAQLPVQENKTRIRGYGVRESKLIDLVVYAKPGALETFPADVRHCLHRCYKLGRAVGLEAMELACRSGSLVEGQGLYFALIHEGDTEAPSITAFVGNL